MDGNEASAWTATSRVPQEINLNLISDRIVHTFTMKAAANRSPSLVLLDLLDKSGRRVGERRTISFRSGGTNRCYSITLPTTANVRRVRISLQLMEVSAGTQTPKLYEVALT